MSRKSYLTPSMTALLLESHAQGLKNQPLADRLGVSLAQVKRYKKQLGLGSNDHRNTLGRRGEQLVTEALRRAGLEAVEMPHGHPFDLQSGSLRLEVKTSEKPQAGRYRFRLNTKRSSNHARYRYTKDFHADSDFLVLVIEKSGELQHLYCIPTALWKPNLWVQPDSPFCPYASFRNALHLLQMALAA